jgi:ATP-binding cassette subfamily F protein uup
MNLQIHLDLEMIEWLETYFAKKITLFMVTDRFFLERVCNEIIELMDTIKLPLRNYLKKEERIASENSWTRNICQKEDTS